MKFFFKTLVPTDIALSQTSIIENNNVGAVVGTLATTDASAGGSYTYTLISGSSDFRISNDTLYASRTFDFEIQSSYTIRIRSNDGNGGIFEKDFIIIVTDGNDAPTNIALSQTSIIENNNVGAVVGTLATTDANTGDSYTYTLVLGSSDFRISNDTLYASKVFDFETQSSYPIRMRTNDGNGGIFEKDFTIIIADEAETGTMIHNGKTYKTVKIGTQWWMAENLNDDGHNSGNSYCYDDLKSNCDTYGRLYEWEAAKSVDVPGWHLPTDDEWKTLEKYLGMSQKAADSTGWRSSGNVGGKLRRGGSSGFDALFGGFYNIFAAYDGLGKEGWFWTASDGDFWTDARDRIIYRNPTYVFRLQTPKSYGRLSVRLIKDKD